ncbi:glycosyltransferase family 2 protein [Maricaulis sp.]|uniref:glycosyltransferase family 2 protein n=1 Tax=Maricaulis sp. TaxID=1486257 RepID=UPI00263441E2|nr:glycosyltransferase family 2 protein [Maricaulis sp.]
MTQSSIAVVVPTYKAKRHILDVLESMPDSINAVYVVDDKCPENSGEHVEANCKDPRVKVLYNEENQGVGGATLAGFQAAYDDGHTAFVKIDSDGQIPPSLALPITEPLLEKRCDYAKGSRFTSSRDIGEMPLYRIVLNSILTFTNKFASGYYSINDPTNGLVAIRREVFERLQTEKIAKRYFFESDMLFHLNLARATVKDVPMKALYADEESGLRLRDEALNFALGNLSNFFKRIFIRHFLMNFSVPAIYFCVGVPMLLIGLFQGIYLWIDGAGGEPEPAGSVILPALMIIVGVNMITSFLLFDVNDEPRS